MNFTQLVERVHEVERLAVQAEAAGEDDRARLLVLVLANLRQEALSAFRLPH